VGWHDGKTWAALAAALVVAMGCQASPTPSPTPAPSQQSTSTATPTPRPIPPLTEIGPGEGALNLIVRPGYAERGDNDSAYDWVTPFEEDSGCHVKAFEAGTSDQMLANIQEEGGSAWDGVSAAGDVAARLIADGLVRAVDVEGLFPAWNDIWSPLQSPVHNTVDGIHYGISQGWAANLLMWDTRVVERGPTSWRVIYDPATGYKGRTAAYDSAIAIADAALYLADSRPDLGITDPYELTNAQFDAAIALLMAQRPLVGTYWGTPLDEIGAFEQGDAVIGPAWPNQLHLLKVADPPVPVEATLPTEGATGWADTWMVLAGAKHPNCMLRWMAWMISPQVQKSVAEYVGEAPANITACGPLDEHHGPLGFAGFCAFHHAVDDAFAGLIRFWKTPLARCGDERGNACVDYSVWQQQWDEIKAAG
jgi:putative spermidine/putrescine transport system substrate-binding protein